MDEQSKQRQLSRIVANETLGLMKTLVDDMRDRMGDGTYKALINRMESFRRHRYEYGIPVRVQVFSSNKAKDLDPTEVLKALEELVAEARVNPDALEFDEPIYIWDFDLDAEIELADQREESNG